MFVTCCLKTCPSGPGLCVQRIQGIIISQFPSPLTGFKLNSLINEAWSLILRWDRSLRVVENRILRRIFGSKNGEWRRLHNEELHSLYRSPNIVRIIKSIRLRLTEHIARMKEGGECFQNLEVMDPI